MINAAAKNDGNWQNHILIRFILGDNLNPIHEYDKDNILDLKFGVDDNTRVNKVGVNNST